MNQSSPHGLAIGGLVALAAGMGLGRFLFTPVLPMMEGAGLDPSAAGLVASANFLGYLLGALAGSLPVLSRRPRAWFLGGLWTSAVTGAAMALAAEPAVWAVLRFTGGVASAFVLVMTSSLVSARLQAEGRPDLGMIPFAGVGTGIALSALIASPWAVGDGDWRLVWLLGGGIAALAAIAVGVLVPPPDRVAHGPRRGSGDGRGLWQLILSYGLFGFGYVVSATFIVAILREGAAGREAEAVVWLMVGLAGIPSIALWSLVARRIGRMRAYVGALVVCAGGVFLTLLGENPVALGVSALALGGTFMAITAIGLQESAARSAGEPRTVMALMTAAFGMGQMVGPAVAGFLREATGSYAAPSVIAACMCLAAALIVAPLARR